MNMKECVLGWLHEAAAAPLLPPTPKVGCGSSMMMVSLLPAAVDVVCPCVQAVA